MKKLLYTLVLLSVFWPSISFCQTTLSRLIAAAGSGNIGYSIDTSHLYYSGNRGGDLMHTQNFDSSFFIYGGGSVDTTGQYYYQTFDNRNNITTYVEKFGSIYNGTPLSSNFLKDSNLYDSRSNKIATYSWKEDYSNPLSWLFDVVCYNTYDANNNLTVELVPGYGKSSFVYDAGNNLIQETDQNWDSASGTWINYQRTNYFYTSGKLISKYIQLWFYTDTSWSNSNATIYTYNSSGDPIQIQELDQNLSYPASSGILQPLKIDSDFYSTSHDLLTSYHIRVLSDSFSTHRLLGRDSNIYDVNHNLLFNYSQYYDSSKSTFITSNKISNLYNSFNQLTYQVKQYSPDSLGVFRGEDIGKYYYETYASTKVSSVSSSSIIDLYPLPANDILNIDIKWDRPESFTVGIYTVQGRLVRQWTETGTLDYHKTIPTSILAQGNYLIYVNSQSTVLTKQFVVTH